MNLKGVNSIKLLLIFRIKFYFIAKMPILQNKRKNSLDLYFYIFSTSKIYNDKYLLMRKEGGDNSLPTMSFGKTSYNRSLKLVLRSKITLISGKYILVNKLQFFNGSLIRKIHQNLKSSLLYSFIINIRGPDLLEIFSNLLKNNITRNFHHKKKNKSYIFIEFV